MSFYHVTHVRSDENLQMRANIVERRIVLEGRSQQSRLVLSLSRADRARLRELLLQMDALETVHALQTLPAAQGGDA